MGATRIFLCDDSPDLRLLLRCCIDETPDLTVAGEAADGRDICANVRAAEAQVAVLDLSMPEVDGLQATMALRECCPDVGIVVLSGFSPGRVSDEVLARGASRYVDKRTPLNDVLDVVREVAAEGSHSALAT